MPLPLSEKLNVVMEQDERFTRSTDSLTKSFSSDAVLLGGDVCDSPDATPKVSITAPTPTTQWSTPVRVPRTHNTNAAMPNGGRNAPRSPTYNGQQSPRQEDQELSEIERLAKQQEEGNAPVHHL